VENLCLAVSWLAAARKIRGKKKPIHYVFTLAPPATGHFFANT